MSPRLLIAALVLATLVACAKRHRAAHDAEPASQETAERPPPNVQGEAARPAADPAQSQPGPQQSPEPQQPAQGQWPQQPPQGQWPQGQQPQGQWPQGQQPPQQGQWPQGQQPGQGQQWPGQRPPPGQRPGVQSSFAPDMYPPGTVFPPSKDTTPETVWGVDGKVRLPRHNERSSLGTNTTFLKDFSGEYPFVDAFKLSRMWFSGRARNAPGGFVWEERKPLALDDRGWVRKLEPGQVARTLFFFFDRRLKYPSGRYVLLYDGDGQMEFNNATVVDVQAKKMVLQVDSTQGGFGLTITQTNPENYLRNMRLIMPGGVCKADPYRACGKDADCGTGACERFEENYRTQIFHPTFLDRMKSYAAIRYENWQDVDNSPQSAWSHRPRLTDARFTRFGAPIEVITELSNRLGAHAWINVPHLADDGYVEGLATYLRDHLDPSLLVYLEHSNEVWNGIYEQARYLVEQAERQKIGRDPNHGAILLHSRRSREIFRIFERVFGGRQRLVRVLSSHPGNPWWTEQLLTMEDAHKEADAVAITGYFGHRLGHPDSAARLKSMTMDQVMDEVAEAARTTIEFQKPQFELAKKFGLQMLAYEGGEHLTAVGPALNDVALNEVLDRAGVHVRMKQIYLDHLTRWKAAGGGLFMHFVNCVISTPRTGRFGALTYLEQPREQAPKFDALMEFIEKNPRWW
jgi:hypothetical protein